MPGSGFSTGTVARAVAVVAVALGSKAGAIAKSGGLLSKLGLLGSAGAATWAATSTTSERAAHPLPPNARPAAAAPAPAETAAPR